MNKISETTEPKRVTAAGKTSLIPTSNKNMQKNSNLSQVKPVDRTFTKIVDEPSSEDHDEEDDDVVKIMINKTPDAKQSEVVLPVEVVKNAYTEINEASRLNQINMFEGQISELKDTLESPGATHEINMEMVNGIEEITTMINVDTNEQALNVKLHSLVG